MLSFFGFLLTTIQYMQRINMSVGIVCMINNTRLAEINYLNKTKDFINGPPIIETLAVENETLTEQQCAFTKQEKNLLKVFQILIK